MSYEIPPRFEGTPEAQLEQAWSFLFRLVERLNVDSPTEQTTVNDGGFTARAYRELRDMIGTNAKALSRISKDKVSRSELWPELEELLRQAEESGDFDGNGIVSVSMDEEYRLTLGFTDGSFYTTPSLRGAPIYETGDVFVTTREGEAAVLLGYGTWSLLASSPAYMWQRVS